MTEAAETKPNVEKEMKTDPKIEDTVPKEEISEETKVRPFTFRFVLISRLAYF